MAPDCGVKSKDSRRRWRVLWTGPLAVAVLLVPVAELAAQARPAIPAAAHPPTSAPQQQRALTFADLMRFRQLRSPVISDDGAWVAYAATPDRGDGVAVVRSARDTTRYVVERGSSPVLTGNGAYAAVKVEPSFAEQEAARAKKLTGDKAPKPGMVLLATATGEQLAVERVQRFAFSADGRWLAYHLFAEPAQPDTARAAEGGGAAAPDGPARNGAGRQEAKAEKPGKRKAGTPLILRELATGREIRLPHVRSFAFDEEGRWLAYAVADPAAADSARDGLYLRDLRAGAERERAVDVRPRGHYGAMTWSEAGGRLAFTVATEDADGKPGDAALFIWDGRQAREHVAAGAAPRLAGEASARVIPANTRLEWSEDGERLFFGTRPAPPAAKEEARTARAAYAAGAGGAVASDSVVDLYDAEAILAERAVDVWHWLDRSIQTEQKQSWQRLQERMDAAVLHLRDGRTVQLEGGDVRLVGRPRNGRRALARDVGPYRRSSTWAGSRYDAVLVDLRDGTRRLVAKSLRDRAALSPGGRFVAWFEDGHWQLFDAERGTSRVLTEGLGVVFVDEDHDRPGAPGSYGIAGWLEGDRALLVYDRFDVWQLPTEPGRAPVRLTDGRPERWMYRVVRTDRKRDSFRDGEALLLHAYNDATKAEGFRRAHVGRTGTERLLEADRKYTVVAKADSADALLFTRQDYAEYPDLWLAGVDFREPVRLTDLDAQREGIAWGSSELVEWLSGDGRPLQGVLIRPGNYEPGKRYPVIVYFYELSSHRLHEFNEPVVNHRPSFPLYASNGYVIFLPDVRFEVGRPGQSAVKALVPGVQKLIDMGIADPARIGLHGHSWGGYQTAYVITQTDIFRTAVAGAPVANMTSAYGGIRWGTGIARQHQYETGQSRLSGSLWEARHDYIDNSPLFFADRVRTPLLIFHGDVDDAVPWYQSIELYLALRRLEKPVVFLQYRDEPHHPRRYANKLDWAMKMKEWFDHYLKDAPAPAWIAEGVPYRGK